ncbi:MAG TPA: tetraacyldisaccharide 4'-kinase [Planctomycetota bacterium]|nr:tetraacyldisaccharide 4'-kinase [Planctomycetota bacterium]
MIRRLRGRWREELPATAWRWLLLPGWLVFRPAVALRNALFDAGWRHPTHLPVPVWSVGNLTAGGTGKTPLTRHLARWAIEKGLRPAIVSRGYRAEPGGANDEARTVSECPVICDADRVAGGRRALADGATCLILDDGFQHRRLHRDLDLVLIDATRPWGADDDSAGATLPLGYLREGRAALARATALVLTRGALVQPQALTALRQELATAGKPLIEVEDHQARLRPLAGGETQHVGALAGRAVVLVSGLGNPLGFERTAVVHGWTVAASLRWPDHHHYDVADVEIIRQAMREHDAVVVMTGKDAVKLATLVPPQDAVAMHVLEVDSRIREADRAMLDRLLSATLTVKAKQP